MTNEQLPFAKTAMTRIVIEKIPKAKRWSVSKEFKSWIDSLSKEQFEAYLDRLRQLIYLTSIEAQLDQEIPKETGAFIVFGTFPSTEIQKREQLARIGGEATAYFALALWRSLQVEELQQELCGKRG
jgi:hypothetical protein